MFCRGHVTDENEAMKLYEAYHIPYQVMKKTGEVRAKMSTSSQSVKTKKAVEEMLKSLGAAGLLDHADVCVDEQGEYVLVAAPYNGRVTDELQNRAELWGYGISESSYRPYAGVNAVVIKKL